MARSIRIEFSGALYHVTSRGNRRDDIYEDDQDRDAFLGILEQVIDDYNWVYKDVLISGPPVHYVVPGAGIFDTEWMGDLGSAPD